MRVRAVKNNLPLGVGSAVSEINAGKKPALGGLGQFRGLLLPGHQDDHRHSGTSESVLDYARPLQFESWEHVLVFGAGGQHGCDLSASRQQARSRGQVRKPAAFAKWTMKSYATPTPIAGGLGHKLHSLGLER